MGSLTGCGLTDCRKSVGGRFVVKTGTRPIGKGKLNEGMTIPSSFGLRAKRAGLRAKRAGLRAKRATLPLSWACPFFYWKRAPGGQIGHTVRRASRERFA